MDAATVAALRTQLRGELLGPDDPGYDRARQVWNAMIDRRPALIARCAGVADVMTVVKFARAHDALVSVRGGGHNVPGNAVCDHGIMIDLSRMKGIRVDPAERTVRAEGGVLWGEFDHETQAFGLATTGGSISDTGIAGLTLGGGIGWLGGKHGLACDNLLAADVVLADGDMVHASSEENPDLLWSLRGGGGNFGVVTSFEYALHPVGPVLGGWVIYPFDRAADVFRLYRDFSRSIPDELNTMLGLLRTPDGVPTVAIAACYNGAIGAGERALEEVRRFGPPLADQLAPMPYPALQQMLDPSARPGNRNYIKTHFVREISDAAIEAMVAYFANAPSPLALITLQQLGAAAGRIPPDATAFGHRDARYELIAAAAWRDPAEDAANVRWARELWEALRPTATGGMYINQMGLERDEGRDRLQAAFGSNYARLSALKATFDTTNFFRHNQNVTPESR
jgi:FAD/FMN-containing dehydrogenase